MLSDDAQAVITGTTLSWCANQSRHHGAQSPIHSSVATHGCLYLFVLLIVSENGMAWSRARANVKREQAWSCAWSWTHSTMTMIEQMATAKLLFTAIRRICPTGNDWVAMSAASAGLTEMKRSTIEM